MAEKTKRTDQPSKILSMRVYDIKTWKQFKMLAAARNQTMREIMEDLIRREIAANQHLLTEASAAPVRERED